MRIARSRLISILLGIALITASAAGFGLSRSDSDYQIVRGTVGEFGAYDEGSAMVDQVQVGTALSRNDVTVRKTTGMFIALRVTVRAPGGSSVRVGHATVVSSSASFDAVSFSDSVAAEPGFESARQFVFEVDPQQLDDLALQGADIGAVTGYYQLLSVHLGITDRNAAAWAAAAQGREIKVDIGDSTRGLP